MRVGIVKDDIFLLHDPGSYHPENPLRLETIYSGIEEDKTIPKKVKFLSPREATYEELLWNHTKEYVDKVASTAGQSRVVLDPDTSTSAKSYEAAIKAVGAQFVAIDELLNDRLDAVFALVRPPGHHAERDRAMGFCLFNNVALAAYYAMNKYGLKKILIIDWDLHHGNGTQHSFYNTSKVLYFSTHQFPYYPGTGDVTEIGEGEGLGFTVNVPLNAGCGDVEYVTIFKKILVPVALKYNPEIIMVSAGFDIFYQDPLGGMSVTPSGIAYLTKIVKEIAQKCCNNKILLTLEGGYNLKGLLECVVAVVRELIGEEVIFQDYLEKLDKADKDMEIIKRVQSAFKGIFF